MVQLKNGSTLLVETPTPGANAVVLAVTGAGAFVTWRKDDNGDTYHGEYFPPTLEGLKGAIESLEQRSGS